MTTTTTTTTRDRGDRYGPMEWAQQVGNSVLANADELAKLQSPELSPADQSRHLDFSRAVYCVIVHFTYLLLAWIRGA